MSENETKVPSSLPDQEPISSIAVMLQGRDNMHLGKLGDVGEKLGNRLVEEEILQLQKKRGGNTGHGDVEGDGHPATHSCQSLAQRLRIKGGKTRDRN